MALNIGFEHVHPITLSNGDVWPPTSLFVGIIFVLRDYAQKEIGHRVLWVMLMGAALSFWMASPALAMASLLAYLASELVDWAIFTFSGWSLRRRVWVSSLASAPVDSLIFLSALGVHSYSAAVLMTLSKWLGIAALLAIQHRQLARMGRN